MQRTHCHVIYSEEDCAAEDMASETDNNNGAHGPSEFEIRRAELVGQIGDVSD